MEKHILNKSADLQIAQQLCITHIHAYILHMEAEKIYNVVTSMIHMIKIYHFFSTLETVLRTQKGFTTPVKYEFGLIVSVTYSPDVDYTWQ